MPCLIICGGHPNMDDRREALRPAHRAHLALVGARLLASGALLADDGTAILDGVTLLDTDDEAEARRFESDDPYARAGIRAKVTVMRWRLRWWRGLFNAEGFSDY